MLFPPQGPPDSWAVGGFAWLEGPIPETIAYRTAASTTVIATMRTVPMTAETEVPRLSWSTDRAGIRSKFRVLHTQASERAGPYL